MTVEVRALLSPIAAFRSTAFGVTEKRHPLFAMIRQEGLRREALTLVAALRQIANGNVILSNGEVRNSDGSPLSGGIDITREIEAAIATNPKLENA